MKANKNQHAKIDEDIPEPNGLKARFSTPEEDERLN